MTTAVPVRAESPFIGLRYFTEQDTELFFGRDEQVDELLVTLNKSRFVTVIGSSGSGKSSLVSAGLIPALRAGYLGASGSSWRVARATPGNDPIANLAAALSGAGALDLSAADVILRRGPLGLVEAVQGSDLPKGDNLLVIADQFEELFRYLRAAALDPKSLANAERESVDFVRLLLEATTHTEVPIFVILTMRSDFLGDCSRFLNMPERINKGLYLVPRMQRDQLTQAIVGPVHVLGSDIAPQLVDRILNDIGHDSDQLPVLQHALLRTWQKRRPETHLDVDAYSEIGGLRGALDRHAEEIFGTFDIRQRYLAEAIFRRITEVDESREIRRPATIEQLSSVAGAAAAELEEVINPFRAADVCFLTQTGTLVDVTHESLIRQWGRLRSWARQEFADRQAYEQIAAIAAHDLATRAWLTGGQLGRAEQWFGTRRKEHWAKLYRGNYEESVEFVRLSIHARDRKQRLRLGTVIGIVLLAFLVSTLLLLKWRETVRQRMLGVWQSAARQALVDLSAHDDDERGILLARQAMLLYSSTPEQPRYLIEGALRKASMLTAVSRAMRGHQAEVLSVAFSTDNPNRLASASRDGTVRVWDISRPDIASIVLPYEDRTSLQAVAWLPGGEQLATGDASGAVLVWRAGEHARPPLMLGHADGAVMSVAVALDGGRVAAGDSGGHIRIWDMRHADAAPRIVASHRGPVNSIAFGPDGRMFSGGDDGTVRVLDAGAGDSGRILYTHHGAVRAVAVSALGSEVVSSGDDGKVILFYLKQNKSREIGQYSTPVRTVAFAPGDDISIAAAGDNGIIALWTGGANNPRLIYCMHRINSVALGRWHGRFALASASGDGTVRLWQVVDPKIDTHSLDASVSAVTFAPSGVLVAANGGKTWPDTEDSMRTEGQVLSVAATVGLNGDDLLITASGKTIRVCDQCFRRFGGENKTIAQSAITVAAAPDTHSFVSGDADGNVKVWELRIVSKETWDPWFFSFIEPRLSSSFMGHSGNVRAVAVAPDSRHIASGGDDACVRVWDMRHLDSGPVLFTGHQGAVNSVAFSSDGRYVASGSVDRTVRVWDMSHPHVPPAVLTDADQLTVNAVAFASTGPILAAGGQDGSIRLWDIRDLRAPPIKWAAHDGPVLSLAISSDGLRLASGGADKLLREWHLWSAAASDLCNWTPIRRNLSMEEWRFYIGEGIPYQRTCPELPAGQGAPN